MPNYRIDIAYDGSGFHGFARQPVVRTVQGELETVLAKILQEPVAISCAGRTDAGVHARGQVLSFRSDADVDPAGLAAAITSLLGPEVVATSACTVSDDFDARFSARWRAYRYRVHNAPVPDPLLRHSAWHVPVPLDVGVMAATANDFVGRHDFASFCRHAEGRSTIRDVHGATWASENGLLVFHVTATSFCHQMVRSLTGLCVESGRGKLPPGSAAAVLEARDRSAAPQIAPPHGLILWEVGY